MGSATIRDEKISLFIENDRPYYMAEDRVEGCAYLIATAKSHYSHLLLFVYGQENVEWNQERENAQSTADYYNNNYISYRTSFIIKQFNGTVNEGQNCFPFAFTLPSTMVGSFYLNDRCYIKYNLRLELVHPTDNKHTQVFQQPLNIIQKPRVVLGPTHNTTLSNIQCCGSCFDCGSVRMEMSASKNFVRNGDPLNVKIKLNNSKGKKSIKKCDIFLRQMRSMISKSGHKKTEMENEWALLQDLNLIQKFSTENLSYNVKIPQNIFDYTAIGRVTARYFLLCFNIQYGSCSKNASANVHLIVHSKTPRIIDKIKMPPPQSWNPVIHEKYIHNMPPYHLNPLPQISYKNQPNQRDMMINSEDRNEENLQTSSHLQRTDQASFRNYEPVYH